MKIWHIVHPKSISGILHYMAQNKDIEFEKAEIESRKAFLV